MNPEHAELLKTFKPPVKYGKRIPYVLFYRTVNNWANGSSAPVPTPTITAVELTGCHMQSSYLSQCLRKPGWQMVDYWIPIDPAADNAHKDGENPLRDCKAFCDSILGQTVQVQEKMKVYEEKIAKYEKQLRDAEATPRSKRATD